MSLELAFLPEPLEKVEPITPTPQSDQGPIDETTPLSSGAFNLKPLPARKLSRFLVSPVVTEGVASEPDVEPELIEATPTAQRMPETLEQLKIELENITHAHVNAKNKMAAVDVPEEQQAESLSENVSQVWV